MLQGIGVSVGIGIGKAVLVQEAALDYSHVNPASTEEEKKRLAEGVAVFVEKTSAMAERMKERVGEHQAEILLGQVVMIQDPAMISQMDEQIEQGQCAEAALDTVCTMYVEMFSAMDDEMMSQRATDIDDMRIRMLKLLLGQQDLDLSDLPPDAVIIAHDLTPSMTAGLRKGSIAGILAEVGGKTSHSAILARTMELPAVLSISNVTTQVSDGDVVVLDGEKGIVFVSPDAETVHEYEVRRNVFLEEQATLSQYVGKTTLTADGRAVKLYGNIGKPTDAVQVMEISGEGVGLFRTEFLFMDRDTLPTEEEQFLAYREAVEAMDGREVIIRTLDVGGDKDIPYLGMEKEDNPFLGFRAVRYCLAREDIFASQLRALLRASAYGDLKIMLPLVTCLDELRAAKALIVRLKQELDDAGIPYNRDIQVGVMIETPAAALLSDLLAKEADFFSIGTNDLTQYIMAADRGNQHLNDLGVPFQPAVLRAIRQIIDAGHEAGIPVGMCGEAASDPRMIPLLLAFGLDEFSVSSSAILRTRKCIAQWTLDHAQEVAEQAMTYSTAAEVRTYLEQL